jgi:hypothetical protein
MPQLVDVEELLRKLYAERQDIDASIRMLHRHNPGLRGPADLGEGATPAQRPQPRKSSHRKQAPAAPAQGPAKKRSHHKQPAPTAAAPAQAPKKRTPHVWTAAEKLNLSRKNKAFWAKKKAAAKKAAA